MREESATRGGRVAAIAARQHGVVAVRQLYETGLDKSAVARQVRDGRLHRAHRGVYAVGHPALSQEGRWMAAVLAGGGGPEGAGTVLATWGVAISHRSAAELWDLLQLHREPVDVTVPGDGGRKRRVGIRAHRSRTISAAEVTLRRGIPVTTPARTIADLRYAVAPRLVRRAIRQAEVLGLPIEAKAADGTRSELESRFLSLCRGQRLPEPEVNARVGSHVVDFLWRDHGLVVETDGYRYHRGRIAFEDDRGRDLALRRRGFDVIRLTFRQIRDEPPLVAAALKSALAAGAAPYSRYGRERRPTA
jgi:very-short-patch-repair endonuclease